MALKVALLIVAVGCGSPGGTETPSDGSQVLDTGTVDGTNIPLTADCDPNGAPGIVRVHKDPRLVILVHDSSGVLLQRIEPDGLSPIDVSVPECASVTSTLPGEIATTIQYVSPGDELFNITRERLGPNDGHVVVEAPFADATTFAAQFGDCFASGSPITPSDVRISDPDFCNETGPTTVLAYPGLLSQQLAFAVFENVTLADTLQTPLRVTQWTTDAALHRIATESPDLGPFCEGHSIADGHHYQGQFSTPTSALTADLKFPEFGSGAVFACGIGLSNEIQRSFSRQVAGKLPSEITILDEELLPIVELAGGNPLHPTFTTTPNVVEEDAVVVELRGNAQWTLVAPRGTREITFPTLPSDLALAIGGGTTTRVRLVESTDLAGYGDARIGLNYLQQRFPFQTSPAVLRTSSSALVD